MNIRYRIDLTAAERDELSGLLSGGRCAARRLKWAQILLAANDGVSDQEIERTIGASGSTIYRTKRRLVECGLQAALSEEPRPVRGAQADRQAGSSFGCNGLRKAAGWAGPLDARAVGRRNDPVLGSKRTNSLHRGLM
jgi:hypothetical protein